MSQNSSFKAVTRALFSFVNADDWGESKRIVEAQPELLLTDEADLLLVRLLIQYADDPNTTRLLEEQRTLLQRCRREGIDAAFADLLRPSAMPDISPDLIVRLMSVESQEELTQLLTEHPELLPLIGAVPQAAPQQRTPDPPEEPIDLMDFIYGEPSSLDPREELAGKLIVFVYAQSRSERKAYLAQHPELLTDEALEVLLTLIEEEVDEDAVRTLREHHVLLVQARQNGLDEAFAEANLSRNTEIHSRIALVERLMGCDSPIAILELAAQEPDLLSDEMDALLQQGIADAYAPGIQDGEAIANRVKACQQILRQLRKTMAQTGKSPEQLVQSMRTRQESPHQRPKRPSQALLSAIEAFGSARSEAERKRIVEQKRDLLLSDAALQVFAHLLEQHKEDPRAVGTFTEDRDLLLRCRKEGIDAAFANRVARFSSKQGIPPKFSLN
ncbi:MAG: hypothetical protein ACPGWR_20435 [Ardenticatenaceae bacterium]